jgi:hypothetical protein
MAAQDLTTLATLKLWLPIASANTNDDVTIERLITAVSLDFMRATKRPDLLKATYAEARQGDGGRRMITYHWPIVAVTTLTVAGATIAASSDKVENGYYFDADIDPERIWNIYLNGYTFRDAAAVKIAYTAGYDAPGAVLGDGEIALPEDIEQAVIDWCAYRYKARPQVASTQRRSNQGESVQSQLIDAPPNVLQVIERYKRELPSIDRRGDEREERVQRAVPRMPKGSK